MAGEGSGTSSENVPKDEKGTGEVRGSRKWRKRLGALVGAIGLIGGVITIVGAADNWFSKLTSDPTCGMTGSAQIERSPNLGISFHQNNQLALMSYANSDSLQTPLIDVCLSSAPFEIWFPALGPSSDVQVCTSTNVAIFRINPFTGLHCLTGGTGVADTNYASGALSETSLQQGEHTEIASTRAEPASGGDDKYYVSRLFTPTTLEARGKPISITRQATDLYLIIFTTGNYPLNSQASINQLEHFILRFK
jgi:hypothetical protein